MIEHKYYLQRHYISLNSKTHRHSNLSGMRPKLRKPCFIALLTSSELNYLFDFLPLADLTRLHEAFHSSKKTK